ncbi:MAG: DUF3570 domain-containing protein [Burkholderiales bacterium]|nr:DUF3570 domain-containing protein [Burkholderiales bacterium]
MRWPIGTAHTFKKCAKAPEAPLPSREAAVAATEALGWRRAWRRLWQALCSLLAIGHAHAVDVPEDKAEALIHVYDGGGISASGPAFLVRKSIADRVSLSGSVYVDMVSNASIDVVTTASPYRERRTAVDLGLDYAYRDATIKLGIGQSSEPDYRARSLALDVSQEVFGGMSSVNLGFTRGADDVGKKGVAGFFDRATHWQYRLGLTQILTPRWLATANFEAIADDGYLGSPYRVARVFGAAVPERDPRTRSGRAMRFGARGDVSAIGVLRGEYRYYWDTWGIKAHTLEFGHGRHVGERWIAETTLRFYRQQHALFYSDNAAIETLYVSRNRQLSNFSSVGLQGKVSYALAREPGQRPIWLNAAYEYKRFSYHDFTDIRTGQLYANNASVLQLYVSSTF